MSTRRRGRVYQTTTRPPVDLAKVPVPTFTWLQWLSEPVKFKKGLRAPYHIQFFIPFRTIPVADVTVAMTLVEAANDDALAGIGLDPQPPLPSQEGASVLIVEVPVLSDGALSIRES